MKRPIKAADNSEPKEKLQKVEANRPKKLNELNPDCLIEIFRYLSAQDLLNVFEYDYRLLDAARYVFKIKHRDRRVYQLSSNRIKDDHQMSQIINQLKGFGGVLSHMAIIFSDENRQFDEVIEKKVLKHCRKSLTSIRFENATANLMDMIKRPFEQVEKIIFEKCDFGELALNLFKWFPRAHNLLLHGNSNRVNPKIFKQHHPQLTELIVKNMKISNCDLINFIKLNPQLKSLTIFFDAFEQKNDDCTGLKMNLELMEAIKTGLKNLTLLYLCLPEGMARLPETMDKIHFDHLNSLMIGNGSTDPDVWRKVPITIGNVDNMMLNGKINGFMKFLTSNRNVKSLSIDGYSNKIEHFNDFIDLLVNLPIMESLRLRFDNGCEIFHRNILMENCQKLNTLVFLVNMSEDGSSKPHILRFSNGKKWEGLIRAESGYNHNYVLEYTKLM